MKKKIFKIILIVVIVIIILIAGLLSYIFFKREYEISKLPDYYKELAKKCKEKGDGCCLASVEIMAKGSYKLKTENECSVGFKANGLECINSYTWCEPIWSDYYLGLAEKCREKHGGPCCIESVNFMEKNGYKLADETGKCPEGFNANGLLCVDTLTWCEPVR